MFKPTERLKDSETEPNRHAMGRRMELKETIEQAKEKSGKDGMFTSESEFSDGMMAIRRDFVIIYGEMVLLKTCRSLNFAAQAQDDHVLVSAKITRLQKKWQGGMDHLSVHPQFFYKAITTPQWWMALV
ncbi:SPX domain-containing protein 4 [Tanacetum coccineum]